MTKEQRGTLKDLVIYTKGLESRFKDLLARAKHLHKERKVLIKQLNLAKKTILAFGYAYTRQGEGHRDEWAKAIKLYRTCDDEMDLDSED